MTITDLIDTGTALPDLEDERASQDRYAVYLLGANPLDAEFKSGSYSEAMHRILKGRSWTVAVLPYSLVMTDFDSYGFLFCFNAIRDDIPKVAQADPIRLEKVVSNDSHYYLVHMDLVEDKEQDGYEHSGKKHFISPSMFSIDAPYFTIPKKDVENYLGALSSFSIGFLRIIRSAFSGKNGFVKAIAEIGGSMGDLKEWMDGVSHYIGEDHIPDLAYPRQEMQGYQACLDFLLNANPSFMKRFVSEFSDYLGDLQPTEPALLMRDHRRHPIYARKSLEEALSNHNIMSGEKSGMYKLAYSLLKGGPKLAKPIAAAMWYYAKATQNEIDKFTIGRKRKAGEKNDKLIKLAKQLDPPLTESEIASLNQFFVRGVKKVYFGTLVAATLMAPLYSGLAALGIGGYAVADYAVRKYRERSYNSETSGIIGVVRQLFEKNK